MIRLPSLRFFSKIIIQLMRWLDARFDNLVAALKIECPEAPEAWIADQVIILAFNNPFQE